MLTKYHRTLALQTRKLRQVHHDELCRPILEKEAASKHPSLSYAVRTLERAKIPAPRGGKWSRTAVWRIVQRLGLGIESGRLFGEFPRCPKCNKQVGRIFSQGYCLTCMRREHRRDLHGDLRRAELADAREKLRYFQDKVQALESGGRHWPAQHPRPTHRFGRPIPGSVKKEKRNAG